MSDPQDVIDRIRDRIEGAKQQGNEWRGRCPAHDDNKASLMFRVGDEGGVIVRCHANCETEKVMSALGMSVADLMGEPYITASYTYTDASNQPLWVVHRWSNKEFRVEPGLPPAAQRVPYNLPWVLYAIKQGQTIYVVEGEKDVETLRQRGFIGTCNVGGAGKGKWLEHYNSWFAGADVVVIADDDVPGMDHARAIFKSLKPHVRTLYLGKPAFGKDVAELLGKGFSIDHLDPVPEKAPIGLVRADGVKPVKTKWAWNGYVPFGTYTLIEGDPGDGKSTLTCDLVARWTSGAPMPDGSRHEGPYSVIMVSAEDDPDATIGPRLMAAGADRERIWYLTHGVTGDPFNLGIDLPALEDAVEEHGVKVLLLDPLMAFMPDQVNGHVDAEVRRSMAPLAALARKRNLAVVVVRHLTKSATRALYAGSGSIGIVGAARSALLVRPDPDTEGRPDVRIVASVKSNLARKPPSLSYQLVDNPELEVASLKWLGQSQWSADDLFGADMEQVTEAAEWLHGLLLGNGGSLSTKELRQEAGKAKIGWTTVKRAAQQLKVHKSGRVGFGTEGYSIWSLVPAAAPMKPTDSSMGSSTAPHGPDGPHGNGPDGPDEAVVIPIETIRPMRLGAEPHGGDLGKRESALVCEICGSEEAIAFEEPFHVVRCWNHDPMTFGGGSDAG
jgi:hypothetical protein